MKIIQEDKISQKVKQGPEVEILPTRQATVLTNGELTAEILIVRVYSLELSYFPTLDFANFWSEVRY